MKTLLTVLLALAVCAVPASAITVSTPANGATVSSPFQLTAAAEKCGSVAAVSMGYSLDEGGAVIEPTSFSARVAASPGLHVLHVKCWGKKTNDQVLLTIHVADVAAAAASPTGSGIQVVTPANGSEVSSPFSVVASAGSCAGKTAVSMGYSIDSGKAVIEPTSFSARASATSGTHVLHVKCWGQGVHDEALVTIKVGSAASNSGTAATPQFSLPSGQYTSQQVVSLGEATAGATIHYTMDGTAPSTASPVYSGPISVTASMVIEAMAAAPGYGNSGLARASYTIAKKSQADIPANAIQVTGIQAMPGWRTKHDPATGGTANGTMSMADNPTLSGQTAKYDTSYSSYGGVLYSVTYGSDPLPSNFVYDAQVWIASGSKIGNLEMDNNQVLANGDTVIYAFQCAGTSGTWDYSENAGTRSNPAVKWVKSNAPCDPQTWATDTWHHVQISYSRDDAGNVTYHSVWLDGVETPINQTVMSDFSLGWKKGVMVANFQVDGGKAGGSSTLYLDDLTISRW